MKTKLIPSIAAVALVALAAFLSGCAVSNFNQAALNTVAEQITTDLIVKDAAQVPALQALADALPTAIGPQSSLTSTSLGALVAKVGAAKGVPSASSERLASGLDGALRNYNTYQGGGNGGPPTIQAAIAGQILQVWADGMQHALTLHKSASGG